MKVVKADATAEGWVFYDGECPMCLDLVRRLEAVLDRRGYRFAPLQVGWVRDRLALPESELLAEMRVLTPAGAVIGGADAAVFLLGQIWWSRPLAWAASVPGAMPILRDVYRWIADNRGCRAGRCAVPFRTSFPGWLPLIVLASAAFAVRSRLKPWAFMWALSVAVFFGFKWWMFAKALRAGATFEIGRVLGYFLLWPGMDAAAFSASAQRVADSGGIFSGVFQAAFGAALFWGVARRLDGEWAAGWCGMVGLVLMLHFGSFAILSRLWRKFGVDAEPLMNEPLRASSLGDFWGNRWNLAFRQLGYELVFVPFRRMIGASGATAAIFLISGLIHDLVISVPAGGGYGLPTAYFVLQGAGVLFEKTDLGRRLGHVFAWIVAAGPAFWLFHPAFVERVMVPFMRAAGALP